MITLRAAALAPCLALSLAGCALPPPRPAPAISAEATRVARASALASWRVEGRIAVSGERAGSGAVRWTQDGAYYEVELRAPVSGETWRLSGDGLQCQLDGLGPEPLRGADPESLLARATGWRLPVTQAARWLRGLPNDARGAAVLSGADGRPRTLTEADWTIEYRAWSELDGGLALPARLVARRPPHEVRIAITRWQLDVGR